MGMRVQQLSEILSQMIGQSHAAPARPQSDCTFEFWTGASGRCYVHSVFALHGCPELPEATFILVKHATDGARTACYVGQTTHSAGSLNLADVRQRAAQCGANEVHVHFLAGDHRDRSVVAFDLECATNLDVPHDLACH